MRSFIVLTIALQMMPGIVFEKQRLCKEIRDTQANLVKV